MARGHPRIVKKSIKATRSANGNVKVKGRAKSDFDIARVDFFVGKLTGKAKGKGNWRFKAPNGRLKVQATDYLGTKSKKIRIKVK
jgi:hypothetical protein